MPEKKKVLFLCTHNSCRSQIAEGLLRSLYGDRYESHSAGTKPAKINPYSIKVMSEIGIDISAYKSKSLEEFKGVKLDYVITVCDNAKKACPVFPGAAKNIHWDLTDPSERRGSEEKMLNEFRNIRDKIKNNIVRVFGNKKGGVIWQ
ncbi:MAG: arsenate reductase ArsC [Candidatus Omnitrophota bacterium]